MADPRTIAIDSSDLNPATLDETTREHAVVRAMIGIANRAGLTVALRPSQEDRSIIIKPMAGASTWPLRYPREKFKLAVAEFVRAARPEDVPELVASAVEEHGL